jgi:hypothetical protein
MSAQLRFRTLVKHAGSIYDAAKEARTGLLMSSLDDIVEKINPHEAADWHKVRHDTQRVLKVWLSREQTHAAQMLADQLMDSLAEFSEGPVTAVVAAAPALPHLEIVEKPAATLLTKQIETDSIDDASDEDEVLVASDDEEDEASEDEEPAPAVNKPAPAPEAEAEDDDEDEDEGDEEVLEPEADADATAEDEEEGMEVEKRTIRGRDYWIDVNTQKLYAVIDDDDVGDEVGAIVNGRPVFLSV